MSSKQFQSAHSSIYKLGTRLVEYIDEIRQSRLEEGDDTKSLESVENNIKKALTALQQQKYQVAVIAAMKAGKSTFLNAIIGADILASETAACTICRTDVRHIPANQVPRLLEYQAGVRKPIVIAEGDEGEIQHKFLLRTRKIRENGNPDNTIRFEIEHHIEAISGLSSLDGFTLVDTPGPNEWESANFNTVALKQTALEALRNCNAILFILNYASYKDSAVSDLFKEVLENRQEILEQEKGKIYFILNKVDQKTERDKEIEDVIKDLQRELSNFGFPNPIIYPASSRQGLLAKLIQQQKATESQTKDFKKFFSARYAIEDEEGNQIIPAPRKIAPYALKDSGIPTIQETVIETITKNAGWNLLSDVLAIIDKAAKTIEDTLNTKISGWEMDIASLKKKIEEYKKRSDNARSKVEDVKKSVDRQKQILINGFSQGIDIFAEETKAEIQYQIDQIAESQSTKLSTTQKVKAHRSQVRKTSQSIDWGNLGDIVADVGGGILELFSKGLGSIFRLGVKGGTSLLQSLSKETPQVFDASNYSMGEIPKISDPYIIRVRSKSEAQKISKTINESCASLIQKFWVDTQDTLVRDGTNIREKLALKIENDIQEISNELSDYLGKELKVKLNINKIQFPKFEFPGIDARIKQQQEVFKRTKQELRTEKNCCSSKTYYVPVEYEERQDFYEVDLRQTTQLIHQRIEEQVLNNRELLQRVIEKQIADDFKKAEQQINDYIKKFQDDFDSLLKERETKESESAKIINSLNLQKERLIEYLQELILIRQSLNTWKP